MADDLHEQSSLTSGVGSGKCLRGDRRLLCREDHPCSKDTDRQGTKTQPACPIGRRAQNDHQTSAVAVTVPTVHTTSGTERLARMSTAHCKTRAGLAASRRVSFCAPATACHTFPEAVREGEPAETKRHCREANHLQRASRAGVWRHAVGLDQHRSGAAVEGGTDGAIAEDGEQTC